MSGNWNGTGYDTCLDCGGPAELGIVMFGELPRSVESLSSIYIKEYFGNGSFVLSNGVIVLSDIELEAYYQGVLVLPAEYDLDNHHDYDCNGCSSKCIDCDSYCYDCGDYNERRNTLYIPVNRKEQDYFDNMVK